MIPGKLKAVDRAHVQHCHVQYQEHLLTAREIEKLANEMEAQLLKADGSFVVKTPSADAMGRNNSALVLNDLMELQLPPLGGPRTIVSEDDVLGGAETVVEAEVEELYEGDAESEDEGSVADDAEAIDDLDDEAIIDISDSAPVKMALDERIPGQRVPRFNYVSLIRHQIDGSSKKVLVRRSTLQDDGQHAWQENGVVRDWLGQQTCEFGNAGFGRESNVMVDCDDAKEKSEDGSNRGVEHVRAVKKKVRTELNPTMTNAFRTEDGAAAWTPSVVKELMTLGPKHSFAMEQIDYSQIPRGAEVLMLQVEHTTKKATGDKKTRVVVNGAQESYKERRAAIVWAGGSRRP